jgi:hypothetical protein
VHLAIFLAENQLDAPLLIDLELKNRINKSIKSGASSWFSVRKKTNHLCLSMDECLYNNYLLNKCEILHQFLLLNKFCYGGHISE